MSALDERILTLLRNVLATDKSNIRESDFEGDIDDTLLATAKRHRLLPLLTTACKKSDALIRTHAQVVSYDAFLRSELQKIMSSFAQGDLLLVPFKGPCLSEQIYASRGLIRQYDDLDFLIQPDKHEEARSIFINMGFSDTCSLPEHLRQRHSRIWGTCFQSPAKDYYVDLQSSVTPSFYHSGISVEELRLSKVEIGDEAYSTICKSDMLILSCLHGAKHYWDRLAWFMDTALLITELDQDQADACLDRAEQLGLRRIVLLGALLCRDVLQVHLPESWSKKLEEDKHCQALVDFCLSRLQAKESKVPYRDPRSEVRFVVRSRERFSDRLACLSRWITEPSYADLKSVELPSSLYFLYYLRRPARLASGLLSAGKTNLC